MSSQAYLTVLVQMALLAYVTVAVCRMPISGHHRKIMRLSFGMALATCAVAVLVQFASGWAPSASVFAQRHGWWQAFIVAASGATAIGFTIVTTRTKNDRRKRG